MTPITPLLLFLCFALSALPAAEQAKPKPAPRKATPPAAPAPAPEPAGFPIQSITIDGNRLHREEQIIALTGVRIGQTGTKQTFEQARDRLLATGYFETVGYRYSPAPSGAGYAVVFEVAEIQQVYPVRFISLNAPEADLRSCLQKSDPLFGDKIPGTKELLARHAGILEDCLKARNEAQKITGELTADRPDDLHIMFRPAGQMPVVADVDFTGTKVLPAPMLREAMRGVAIGSRYTESRFRELLDTTIRPLYEARGRLAVSFPKVTAQPAPGDIKGLKVMVEVAEGETYTLSDVKVEGTASLNQELYNVAGLKVGDLANFHEVQAALQRVVNRMRRDGYMKATARSERRLDEKKKTADLVIAVDPGPQYTFGKLLVTGLDLNGEHEIRRIWGLKPGEPFRADYPDFFLQQVREQGVFDDLKETRSEVAPDEKTLTVTVTLIFNPDPVKKLPSTFDDPFKRKPQPER